MYLPELFIALRITYRARLVSIVLWLLITLTVTVLLAAQFSARQPVTVAMDVGISIIRLALPLFVILLVQELFNREFERKSFLNTFTYPRTRLHWLLGRAEAIALLGALLLTLMGLLLAGLTLITASTYQQATPVSLGAPYFVTLGFIAIDMFAVIAIATLLAVSAITPSFVLIGTAGFTLIARSYTPIIELLRSNPYVISEFADPRLYQDSLGLIAVLLPDLGRLDVRMIALYDKMAFMPPDWPLLVGATLSYSAAVLGLSTWILNKREFS